MTVYVDSWNVRLGRMTMCHMIADTEEELHAMADRIGVSRRWFQSKSITPHYDICLSKKRLAIQHGAIVLTLRELDAKLKELRGRARNEPA